LPSFLVGIWLLLGGSPPPIWRRMVVMLQQSRLRSANRFLLSWENPELPLWIALLRRPALSGAVR